MRGGIRPLPKKNPHHARAARVCHNNKSSCSGSLLAHDAWAVLYFIRSSVLCLFVFCFDVRAETGRSGLLDGLANIPAAGLLPPESDDILAQVALYEGMV